MSALDNIPLPPGIDREKLRADLEGMRSLLRTRRELCSPLGRQQVTRAIETAEDLWMQLSLLGVEYFRFRPNLRNLIDALEKDQSPALVKLLNIKRGVSEFDTAISLIADRYRHHFDAEPGYSTNPLNAAVTGPFIRFAEAILVELGVYKKDGSRYAPAAIKEALKKLRRVRV
jgi:hypothetical protein